MVKFIIKYSTTIDLLAETSHLDSFFQVMEVEIQRRFCCRIIKFHYRAFPPTGEALRDEVLSKHQVQNKSLTCKFLIIMFTIPKNLWIQCKKRVKFKKDFSVRCV